MKITPIKSYKNFNPSFGQISSKSIDFLRNRTEGYNVTIEGDNILENYSLDSKFQLFDTEELEELKSLTARASKLNKSLINQSGISDGIDVIYRDAAPIIKTFEFDKSREGDKNYALGLLQSAVKFAERIEVNPENRTLFSQNGNKKQKKVKANFRQIVDRFRNKFDNNLMQTIYDDTITIQQGKSTPKTKSKKGNL